MDGAVSAWATSSSPPSPEFWLDWFTIVGVIEAAALAALAAYGIWRFVLRRPIAATTPLPFGLFLAPAIWAGWIVETIFFAR